MSEPRIQARYWTAVLYPESMVDGWQDNIDDILQIPYEYCIHDRDNLGKVIKTVKNKFGKDITYDATEFSIEKHEERKVHVHLIIAFSNTTTYKHALSIFKRLMPSCVYCEQVLNIRYLHEYLIHNTEKAKRDKKYLYDSSCRISGNNFDIGAYEQISLSDKRKMCKELCDFVVSHKITNFTEFYISAFDKFGMEYFEIVCTYSGLIERLCKGNYLILNKELLK